MRLFLDTCISRRACARLREAGHDVAWSGEWESDPGDEAILSMAHREGRILITLDKDFGELAVVYKRPHSGIVRLVNLSARDQAPACLTVLGRYGSELKQGAIVTIETGRIRIRPPLNR